MKYKVISVKENTKELFKEFTFRVIAQSGHVNWTEDRIVKLLLSQYRHRSFQKTSKQKLHLTKENIAKIKSNEEVKP